MRRDHGGKNIDVWQYMMTAHEHHQCVVVGSSTHTEQIERLWRDVHCSVLVTFRNRFCELAEEGHLDVLNEVDMFRLHTVYLPRINKSLLKFTASWNNHVITTEGM